MLPIIFLNAVMVCIYLTAMPPFSAYGVVFLIDRTVVACYYNVPIIPSQGDVLLEPLRQCAQHDTLEGFFVVVIVDLIQATVFIYLSVVRSPSRLT